MATASTTTTPQPACQNMAATIARLKETYGLSEAQLRTMDPLRLVRTAATLDFLRNNLPASVSKGQINCLLI